MSCVVDLTYGLMGLHARGQICHGILEKINIYISPGQNVPGIVLIDPILFIQSQRPFNIQTENRNQKQLRLESKTDQAIDQDGS